MNKEPLKEINLVEWDADINNLGRGKVGETIEYEVQPRLMIPEDSLKKKGQPRYKIAFLQEDIKKRTEDIIKFHEGRIEHIIETYNDGSFYDINSITQGILDNLLIRLIEYEYESIMEIEDRMDGVI